jgi:hypothetical protein
MGLRSTGTGGTSDKPAATAPPGAAMRTEFIILFIWQEPTPSDTLRGGEGDSTGATTSQPATQPGMKR